MSWWWSWSHPRLSSSPHNFKPTVPHQTFPFSLFFFIYLFFYKKKNLLISQQILIIVFHHVFVWCIGGSMGLDTINYLYLLLKKKGVVVFLMMLSYNWPWKTYNMRSYEIRAVGSRVLIIIIILIPFFMVKDTWNNVAISCFHVMISPALVLIN